MKRFVAMLMVVLLAFSATGAWAVEEEKYESETELYYEHTDVMIAKLTISNGIAACKGTIGGSDANTTSSLTVTLYQNNGGWKKLDSWSASGKGRTSVTASGTKTVAKGFQYKVVASGTIKDDNGQIIERPSNTKTVTY